MLRDALEFLFRAGAESSAAKLTELPDGTSLLTKPGGETERVTAQLPARDHLFFELASFIAAVEFYAVKSGDQPVVWVHSTAVVAVLDDDDQRRHSLKMALTYSDQYAAIRNNSGDSFTQSALIKWLKANFALDIKLLAALRKVDFTRTGSGNSSREHGRETLGRSVEAAVQGTEEIPESFTVNIPAYSNSGLRAKFPMELRINIDVENHEFELFAGPNEECMFQEQATDQVLQVLKDRLPELEVFNGFPN